MACTRRARGQAPRRLILDSGAVIALARGDQRARALKSIPEIRAQVGDLMGRFLGSQIGYQWERQECAIGVLSFASQLEG
jgi:hypothetical protein